MNKILTTLGLPATATEEDAVAAITGLQGKAGKVEALELARIEQAVDVAIAQNKVTAARRDALVKLGKTAGFETLQSTLEMFVPARKPNDIIRPGAAPASPPVTLAYGQMSEEQLRDLRESNPDEFTRLFKAEFGFVPTIEK